MARSSEKRTRPDWWTPEGVLVRLQNGEYVGIVCKLASDEMEAAGLPMGVQSLRAEISKWSESATWGEQFKAALALWKRGLRGEFSLSKDWHEEFFAAMDACGGKAEDAAPMAGVSYGIVLALTDKRNKCYDPEFAERFRVAELERVGRIRGRYMETAEGEGKLAMRAQERLIESALPSLHGAKQEIKVSGEVEVNHNLIAPGLAKEVALASQRMMRVMNRRVGELPAAVDEERQVIDVTPARERAQA